MWYVHRAMRRITHTFLGAAVAIPVAMSLEPVLAAGCLWWGMVGGGLPDWFDLRSELRHPLRLRHRGVSHSLIFLIIAVGSVYLLLDLLRLSGFSPVGIDLTPPAEAVRSWVLTAALGILSHLASDACTHGGIRPLLPFSRLKVWLVPPFLRSRFDGYLDVLFRLGAIGFIGVGTIAYVATRMA